MSRSRCPCISSSGITLALLAAVASACSRPESVPVIGPDGTHMFHVSCGSEEAQCFQLAGSACPDGYDMLPTREHNYLVRCRSGFAAASPPRGNPYYSSPLNAQTLAPNPYVPTPLNVQTLAPNPYAPAPAPPSTATYPPLLPAPAPSGDLGY